MIKIADDSDKKYAYLYASSKKELKKVKKFFAVQVVDTGAPIFYNGKPAIMVRKSN